jgi:hypothetical protein
MGVPLLRTRGERDELEIDLCLRIESTPELGPFFTLENRTFEDAHDSPVRFTGRIAESVFEKTRNHHEEESQLVAAKLGPQRLRTIGQCNSLLQGYGGLVSLFALKSPQQCRDLEKFLIDVKPQFAANRGIPGRQRLVTNFVLAQF